jgi:CheY-like chemotaxis protein
MAKVLLVEDDNNLREIYQARLTAEGYDIVAAQDGEEALVLAKKEHPDLIISDVMMPRISGFEMLDILRNTDELKNTKIIMLTALGQAEDQGRADNLGADKYLVKSQVTLEDIIKCAQELLGETPAEPAAAAPPEVSPVATTAPTPAAVPEPVAVTPVVDAPTTVLPPVADTPTVAVATPVPEPPVVATPAAPVPEPVVAEELVVPTPPALPATPSAETEPAPAAADTPTEASLGFSVPTTVAPAETPELAVPSIAAAPTAEEPAPTTAEAAETPAAVTPESTETPVAVPDEPATPVETTETPESVQPSIEAASMPDVPAGMPTESPEASVRESGPQTLEDEEAAIEQQISTFMDNPDAVDEAGVKEVPAAEAAANEANDDAVMANAVEELVSSVKEPPVPVAPSVAAAEAAKEAGTDSPAETPETTTSAPEVPEPAEADSEQPVTQISGEQVTVAGKKVIRPLGDGVAGPTLDELLAKEAAKEQPVSPSQTSAAIAVAAPSAPAEAEPKPLDPNAPIVNGTPQQPAVMPPSANGKPFDPNSISL